MEKHTNKKVFAGLIAITSAFALGGCDPVESLPKNYNDPILEYLVGGNKVETDDNIMGEIYNKISSDKNNKVLQIVLDELAERKFGTYTDIENAHKNDNGQKAAYVEAHKEFFKREGDANGDAENRFDKFYEDVSERVSEAFYNLITSGSYNDKNTGMFSEEKLYTELTKDFWDLQPKTGVTFNEFYVTKKLTKENAKSFLNMNLYSNSDATKRGYIEKKVFPQILKDKLVEQYIFDNNYDSLGRSYARNVNMVKVPFEDKTRSYTTELMKKFTGRYEFKYEINTDYPEVIDYKMIQEAINGFEEVDNNFAGTKPLLTLTNNPDGYSYTKNDEAFAFNVEYKGKEIIPSEDVKVEIDTTTATTNNEEYFTTIDGTQIFNLPDNNTVTYKFFGFTKLGELMDSYTKAIRADQAGELRADPEDKAELDKFTGGKSLADSLREKILALDKEDYVTEGWFVKNGGLSELPAALRDRLFSINVANNLDETYDGTKNKGYFPEGSGTLGNYRYLNGDPTKAKLTRTPYIRDIYGRKFVMAANPTDYDVDPDNFVYNDGSAFYICQVLEAPNAPKLRQSNESSVYTAVVKEEISRSIAKVLSTKDTYITNAYTEYLEEYKFTFNDSSLYDYFKGQYPDLFDDED